MDLPVEHGDFPELCKRLPEGIMENAMKKWMMNRGSPILGNLHIVNSPSGNPKDVQTYGRHHGYLMDMNEYIWI